MSVSKKYVYAPYLLVAVVLLAAAVVIYPHDVSVFHALQAFSNRVGKFHLIREILEMFRPFGQGDVVLMMAVGLGICGARRRALHIVMALAVMSILIWPVKIGVGRERPAFKNFQSFPSGDAATAAAFVTPLVSLSPWMLPAAVLVTGGVCMERAYYGRHYASDVLAGAAFGVLSGAIALVILRRWRWVPPRRWFAAAGALILILAMTTLFRARGASYLLDVLRVWGPLGVFLILARLIPVWKRKHRTSSSAGFGYRLWLATGAMAGGVIAVVPWFLPIFGLRIPLVAMGLIILAMARTLRRLSCRKCPEAIIAVTMAGVACLLLAIGTALLPAITAFRASVQTF